MKFSLNWIKQYVPVAADTAKLSDLLTFAGIEVEGIEEKGGDFPNVVVGKVISYVPHPNADRLRLCQVDDGSGMARQIVCGAKNFDVGSCVPLALPGAVLPGDFKIKKGKLRGEVSEGMMCSAKELLIAEDADGLLILPPDSVPGTPISQLLDSDTVVEVEITPNRPDLLSHVGIARELALLTSQVLTTPMLTDAPAGDPAISVCSEAIEDCPHYTATVIRGVKVGPSPDWLAKRLTSIGLRPINNIVDITNFVLMELGQPLHAFDRAKLTGGIVVRHARDGETLAALDGSTVKLATNHLVIADESTPVALAGIMGGEPTGVKESTTEIVLESAYFRPACVRRTSREVGISSDSSYRFERGVDPAGVESAALRAIDLVLEIAGGEVVGGIASAGAPKLSLEPVTLRNDRCRKLLGADIADQEIVRILTALGLKDDRSETTGTHTWQIPSFRADLTREVDLIEEVIRVHGIENVPSRNLARFLPASASDLAFDFRRRMSRKMIGAGFYEARTTTLVREASLVDDVFGPREILRIKNPLGEDSAALRPSLIPGLLSVVETNIRKSTADLRLFEAGRVFEQGDREERRVLAMVMTGRTTPTGWQSSDAKVADLFSLKGVIESFGIPKLTAVQNEKESLALCAAVYCGKTCLGHLGQLTPARARDLGTDAPVLVAELDFDALREAIPVRFAYREIPRFPAMTRDIAMLLPLDTPHAAVADALRSANEALLDDIVIFDIFTDPTGEKVPADRKSVAYSLTYRSYERTLQQAEVNDAHARMKQVLNSKLGADFRE